MRTYREPTDLDRAALRAMGHDIDQRFRVHEGDDYPMTDEDRAFRAVFWRVAIVVNVAALSALVLALLPTT